MSRLAAAEHKNRSPKTFFWLTAFIISFSFIGGFLSLRNVRVMVLLKDTVRVSQKHTKVMEIVNFECVKQSPRAN